MRKRMAEKFGRKPTHLDPDTIEESKGDKIPGRKQKSYGETMLDRIASFQANVPDALKLKPGNMNEENKLINPNSEKLRQLQMDNNRYRAGLDSHNIQSASA